MLLGSKLKFKMTEFGLEIISTVETEDGQVEFSTTSNSGEQSDKKEPISNQSGDVKKETDDKGVYMHTIDEAIMMGQNWTQYCLQDAAQHWSLSLQHNNFFDTGF